MTPEEGEDRLRRLEARINTNSVGLTVVELESEIAWLSDLVARRTPMAIQMEFHLLTLAAAVNYAATDMVRLMLASGDGTWTQQLEAETLSALEAGHWADDRIAAPPWVMEALVAKRGGAAQQPDH